jgi:phosphatidylserine decarboxylase
MASLWVATHSSLDILTENERLVMEIDSPDFGPVVQVG